MFVFIASPTSPKQIKEYIFIYIYVYIYTHLFIYIPYISVYIYIYECICVHLHTRSDVQYIVMYEFEKVGNRCMMFLSFLDFAVCCSLDITFGWLSVIDHVIHVAFAQPLDLTCEVS